MAKTPRGHAAPGSFVVTGACAARLDKVGTDCYAARITGEARRRKRHRSEMMRALDRLLRFISIAIIPVFVIMFAKQYFFSSHRAGVRHEFHRGRHHRHDPRGALPSGERSAGRERHQPGAQQNAGSRAFLHRESGPGGHAVSGQNRHHHRGLHGSAGNHPLPGMEGGALAELLGSFTAAAGEDNATAQALRARFGALGGGWQLKAAVPSAPSASGCSGAERRRRIHPRRTGDRLAAGMPPSVR